MKKILIALLFLMLSLSACATEKEIDQATFTYSCNYDQTVIDFNKETAKLLYESFKEIELDQKVDGYDGCFGTLSFYFDDGTKDEVTIINHDVIAYQDKTYKIKDRTLYITLVGVLDGNENRSFLTLEDLKTLVNKKGEELTYNDLKDYVHLEVGSGLSVTSYPIDNDFYLLLGTPAPDEKPMYIYLMSYANSDDHIDIRFEDIDKFVEKVSI